MDAPARLRVDKWLWYARIAKTRSFAQTLVRDGKVRVDGTRISSASRAIEPGNVLTVVKGRQILVVKILSLADRRGPAPEAQALYEDLSPAPPPREPRPLRQAVREEGAGRPTKRERREIERLRGH